MHARAPVRYERACIRARAALVARPALCFANARSRRGNIPAPATSLPVPACSIARGHSAFNSDLRARMQCSIVGWRPDADLAARRDHVARAYDRAIVSEGVKPSTPSLTYF